jgi:recombination protein RecA
VAKKSATAETEENAVKKDRDDYYLPIEYILERKTEIISICPALDIILDGGIRSGSLVVFSGPPGLGKTSYALNVIKNAQKIGRVGVYVNVEERIEASLLRAIKDLDLSADKFKIITSQAGDVLSAERYLSRTERILNEFPKAVVLVDSFSNLCSGADQVKEYGSGYGLAARKLEAEFCRRCSPILSINQGVLIGVAHTVPGMGQYASTTEKMSRQTNYQTNLKLRCSKGEPYPIMSGDTQVGHRISWEILKNSFGPPGQKTTSHLRYGIGPDEVADTISTAVDLSIIKKSGAWYKIPDVEKQVQGEENLCGFLQENEKIYQDLSIRVKDMFK